MLQDYRLIDPYSIFGEIGPGERIALSKLAVEHYEKTSRPFRIAIDVSIWHFQIQSGKGGSNPALRTLYYRLLRLLALNIQPLFVFDGPQKPPFKRNVKTSQHAPLLPNYMTKQFLKLFGFPFHTAPGEAEAECALLQRKGLVDAVLSEDVDTLMFGCRLSLRNWTSEGTRGNKSPTHVNVYEAEATKEGVSGLDRNGMILIALMSGGDYIPAGIPGCGIKIACEAARAGFGADLCKLSGNDKVGLEQWRERLAHELKTNESRFFRCKHKALSIPENFPDTAILSYYTHPMVSSSEGFSQLSASIKWDSPIEVVGLRLFVTEAFEWQNLAGAKKFIRGLAPALLVRNLRLRGESETAHDDLDRKEAEEVEIITNICGRRNHFMTDEIPEYRVTYTPADVVGLDLEKDRVDDDLITAGYDSENPCLGAVNQSPMKRSTYDPTEPEKIWLLETWVKVGVPLMAENWEENMRNPKKRAITKARQKSPVKGKKQQALGFVKVGKPGTSHTKATDIAQLPPVFLAPCVAEVRGDQLVEKPVKDPTAIKLPSKPRTPNRKGGKPSPRGRSSLNMLEPLSPTNIKINPWTLAKRPSDTYRIVSPSRTRYSALGLYKSPEPDPHGGIYTQNETAKALASPPTSPVPYTPKKHPRPFTPSVSEAEDDNKVEHTSSSEPCLVADACDLYTSSPRKKRTPTKATSNKIQTQGLQTPKSFKLKVERLGVSTEDATDMEPLTSQKVNRKLDFSPTPPSPASISSSLPSLSTLLSPPPPPPPPTRPLLSLIPMPKPPDSKLSPPSHQDRREGRLIALCKSLDGTWKLLDEWEADDGLGRNVYKNVEVLDMTGD